MKKIFTILSLTGFLSLNSHAQCAGGLSTCTPDPTTASGSFKPSTADFPCVVRGTAFNESVSIKIPASVTQPQQANIDSVKFVSIANLPCGLCYSFNKASKMYKKDEIGCITFSGLTNDVKGQYTLDIQMYAWLQGSTSPTGPVSTSLAGLDFILRVDNSLVTCPVLVPGDPGLTASCKVGIQEVGKDIHAVAIVPNPMHSSATLNFESDNAGVYTVDIVNVLGKVVSSNEVKVAAGNNQVIIERNTLTEGVYFVQIANGKSIATTKFVIAD